MQQISSKIKGRVSILIKSAELIYRDTDKMNNNDMVYYLLQIITEAQECLDMLNYCEKDDKV